MPRPKGSKNKKAIFESISLESVDEKISAVQAEIEKLTADLKARNEKKIAEYVRNQLQEDQLTDQIGLREYFDPFTGEPDNKSKK